MACVFCSQCAAFFCGLLENASRNSERNVDPHAREGGVLMLRDCAVFLPDRRNASGNNFGEEFQDAFRECDRTGFEDVGGSVGFWDSEDQGVKAILRDDSRL